MSVRRERWRGRARWGLVALYGAAGALHLAAPAPFLRITPGWVPSPGAVIAVTGLAELAGAMGLAQSRSEPLRRWAGAGLALYALAVWPANVNHMMIDLGSPGGGLGWWYHGPRMALQPLLIWAALWAGGVVDRPWRNAPSRG